MSLNNTTQSAHHGPPGDSLRGAQALPPENRYSLPSSAMAASSSSPPQMHSGGAAWDADDTTMGASPQLTATAPFVPSSMPRSSNRAVSFGPVHTLATDHRGNQYPQTHRGPSPPEDQESPIKAHLRSEVENLRDHLHAFQRRAYDELEQQRAGFQTSAAQYEQQARDVTAVELAQQQAQAQAQYNTTVGAQAATIDRANQRLQQQSLRSQEKQASIEAEANRVFQATELKAAQDKQRLVDEAREALAQQHQTMATEANDAIAMRQDAIVHEAKEALHQQAQHL